MKKHLAEIPKRVSHSAHPPRHTPAPRALSQDEAQESESCSTLETIVALPEGGAESPSESASVDLRLVRFGFFQPDARDVFLAGSFNGWDPRATPLKRDSIGDWSVELALSPGEHRYRLIVDGEWCDDPTAQRLVANPFGGFDAAIQI